MLHNQKSFVLTCSTCGHVSNLVIASETLSLSSNVRCPVCGDGLGALAAGEIELAEKPGAIIGLPRRRRAMNLEVVERRQSSSRVKPYLKLISDWHFRTAFLRAELFSPKQTDKRRLAIRLELGEIRGELLSSLDEIRRLAATLPRDSRVTDLRLALERLDEQLAQTIRQSSVGIRLTTLKRGPHALCAFSGCGHASTFSGVERLQYQRGYWSSRSSLGGWAVDQVRCWCRLGSLRAAEAASAAVRNGPSTTPWSSLTT